MRTSAIAQSTQTNDSYLPGEVFRRNDSRAANRIRPQERPPVTTLTNSQGDKIIYETASEDPVAGHAGEPKAKSGQDLNGRRDRLVLGECNAAVVEEVKNPNSCKRLGHNVGEHRAGGRPVHRWEFGECIVQLSEGVDGDKDMRNAEALRVPEHHPCWNALADGNLGFGTPSLPAMQMFPRA